MRVPVTGGAGFIGSHVAGALASAGHEVRVLDALLPCVHPGGIPSFSRHAGFDFVHGDVRDAQTVDDALRGVGAVCHLAAMVGSAPVSATRPCTPAVTTWGRPFAEGVAQFAAAPAGRGPA